MINESEVLNRPPDFISDCGEEVWRNLGSDFSIVRLQYKARTNRFSIAIHKQWFYVLSGSPTLELNQGIIQLRQGSLVTFIPGDIYQVVNKAHEDVVLVCQGNIKWVRECQPVY